MGWNLLFFSFFSYRFVCKGKELNEIFFTLVMQFLQASLRFDLWIVSDIWRTDRNREFRTFFFGEFVIPVYTPRVTSGSIASVSLDVCKNWKNGRRTVTRITQKTAWFFFFIRTDRSKLINLFAIFDYAFGAWNRESTCHRPILIGRIDVFNSRQTASVRIRALLENARVILG